MLFFDAALAFAVTMLLVATVIAKIVDFIYGVLFLRNRLFEEMLNKVAPLVQQDAAEYTANVRLAIEKLLAREQRTWAQWIWRYISGQLPSGVSVDEFIRLMGATVAADEHVKKLEASLKSAGDELTDYLRQRSRWVAFLVALGLAFFLNIDSVNIADKYIHTPSLSATIAGNADAALQESQKVLAATSKLDSNATPGQQSAAKALEESAEKIQQQINQLNSSSFPIGQSYFPYSPYTKVPAPSWEVRLRWFAGIMLTCLCAGLGTPFWYDLITNLTRLTQPEKGDKSRPIP